MLQYLTAEEKSNPYTHLLHPFKFGKREKIIYGLPFVLLHKSKLIRSMMEEKLEDGYLMPSYDNVYDEKGMPEKSFLYVWYCVNGFSHEQETTEMWKSFGDRDKLKTWTYFNYLDVSLTSMEISELKLFANTFDPRVTDEKQKNSLLETFEQVINSGGHKLFTPFSIQNTLTRLMGKNFSATHISCIKICNLFICIDTLSYVDDPWKIAMNDSSAIEYFSRPVYDSFRYKFNSPTLRICGSNLSAMLNFLVSCGAINLVTPAIVSEFMRDTNINEDIFKYTFDSCLSKTGMFSKLGFRIDSIDEKGVPLITEYVAAHTHTPLDTNF